MAGKEWQLYNPPSGGLAAADTLLALDVSNQTDNTAGTVAQVVVSDAALVFASLAGTLVAAQLALRATAN